VISGKLERRLKGDGDLIVDEARKVAKKGKFGCELDPGATWLAETSLWP
jgi:hypothetical protein